MGDGSFGYVKALRQYRVRWFSGTKDVLEKVQSVLAKQGIRVSIQKDRRGLFSVSTLNQKFVHRLLAICGLEKFGPKDTLIRVPEIIGKSPIKVVKAFLAGLVDSDGYVAVDGSPSYCSVSRAMAEDLSALVSLLGYRTSLKEKDPYGKGKRPTYILQICPLPQVNQLAVDLAPYLANKLRQSRLQSSSRKQTSLPLNFCLWRDKLVSAGLSSPRGAKKKGIFAAELSIWASHNRVRRGDIAVIAKHLSKKDKSSASLLERIANSGQEVRTISKAKIAKTYYDLSVGDWNTYAAGQSGLVMIHNTGFSFSRLRPYGDVIASSGGTTVGPCSFLQAYNDVTSQVKQGGVRRGANMGIMHITHPDILRFAVMKVDEFSLTNFNISVTVIEEWMEQAKKDEKFVKSEPEWEEVINEIKAAQAIRDVDLKLKKVEEGVAKLYDLVRATEDGEGYELINPRTGEVADRLNAHKVFLLITQLAWHYGDPGMIMIDRINKSGANPTPALGQIEATNPCVTGDTLISTQEGLVTMKDVVVSHFAGGKRYGGNMSLIIDKRTLDPNESGTMASSAIKFYDVGIRDVLKLVTKTGLELKATANHRVLAPSGWVELKNLKSGDKVLIQSGKGDFGQNYDLPVQARGVNLPIRWSKELGQILGWLIGDGWLRDGDENLRVGFTFGEDDREVLEYFQKIINNWYGKDIKFVKRERNTYHLSYHSKVLVDFFMQLGVKPLKASDKVVPESIYTAPEEAVVGFIQGLFSADGTVRGGNTKTNSDWVALTSKSKKLLQGVQLLLLNLGIKSSIFDRRRKLRTGMFPYQAKDGSIRTYSTDGILYELGIFSASREKFKTEIGFINKSKQTRLKELNLHTIRKLKNPFLDVVTSVEECGKERVYDVTEPMSHSVIANGLIVHQCGEQPLLPYDSCTLGSINVGKFVKDGTIDYEGLALAAEEAVHFLDNVLDMNSYPIPEIREMAHKIRRIGLGLMGFADLLVQLGIGYNSEEGLAVAEDVMSFVHKHAKEASARLADTRGVFPSWEGSIYDPQSPHFLGTELKVRNGAITTIAPTGTIAMLADASSGIEPYFGLSYAKNTIEGKRLFTTNPFFLKIAKDEGFYFDKLLEKIEQNGGSVQGLSEVPQKWQAVFVVTKDISPEWHVRMQAAFQKHVDNAISKTINFPNAATVGEVRQAYMMVYEMGCKGITIYRDGSRVKQVLEVKKDKSYYDQLAAPTPLVLGPVKAPTEAWGVRIKKKSDVGNVYTAVFNTDEGMPVEVFVTVGKSGGYVAGAAEVTGRLASLALKHGASLEEVASELIGIACGTPYGIGPMAILSMFDAAGKAILETSLNRQLPLEENNTTDTAVKPGAYASGMENGNGHSETTDVFNYSALQSYQSMFAACPDCGSALMVIEGCKKCSNPACGFSKC